MEKEKRPVLQFMKHNLTVSLRGMGVGVILKMFMESTA